MKHIFRLCFGYLTGFALLLFSPGPSQAQKTQDGDDFYGRKYAIVIGNSKYDTKPLVNPENDAADIAAVLGKTGFKVTTVLNADKATLQLAVAKFQSTLPKRAAVFIFYAGHAVQYQAQNVLLPVDAIGKITKADDIFAHGVVLSDVLQQFLDRENSVTTVVLDACRDSPFPDKPELAGGLSRSAGVTLAKKDDGKRRKGNVMEGVIIAYSTAPQMTAADGEGRNSPYTKHLKEFLRRPNTTLETMLKLTRTEVTKETGGKQTPWYETSINGEFYPAGRGRIEFDDLLRLLVPAKGPNDTDDGSYLMSWNFNEDLVDPIDWDAKQPSTKRSRKPKQPDFSFENVFDHFIKNRGEVAILMDGKPTHSGKWEVWLMGPRGGYTEVYLTSSVMGFGGPNIADGFGQSSVTEAIPACRNDDGIHGSRVFKVNIPGHFTSWLAEKFTCGAANCQADYMLFFNRQDLKRYGCR